MQEEKKKQIDWLSEWNIAKHSKCASILYGFSENWFIRISSHISLSQRNLISFIFACGFCCVFFRATILSVMCVVCIYRVRVVVDIWICIARHCRRMICVNDMVHDFCFSFNNNSIHDNNNNYSADGRKKDTKKINKAIRKKKTVDAIRL